MLLGAAAVMSNGTVISRVGSAATAMAAFASNRPVIICCETHKFAGGRCSDAVSFTHSMLCSCPGCQMGGLQLSGLAGVPVDVPELLGQP